VIAGGEEFVAKITDENPVDIMIVSYGESPQKCGL
jgi:hypothetical protein